MILISCYCSVDPIREYKLSIRYIVSAQTMLAATVIIMIVASCSALRITPLVFIFIILNLVESLVARKVDSLAGLCGW